MTNTNERFDEQFTSTKNLNLDILVYLPASTAEDVAKLTTHREIIKTFISTEKNLLLDQAIEVVRSTDEYKGLIYKKEAIDKLKDLKE